MLAVAIKASLGPALAAQSVMAAGPSKPVRVAPHGTPLHLPHVIVVADPSTDQRQAVVCLLCINGRDVLELGEVAVVA